MTDNRDVLIALLQARFMAMAQRSFQWLNPGDQFMPNWHLVVMAHYLEEFAAGRIKRLIITLPPRGSKSLFASAALPVWILGHDPTRRIICVSYSAELAAGFSRQSRQLLQAPWCQEVFPRLRLGEKVTEDLITTRAKGYRLATSVGGALTGLGGDFLIIDDPTKADDAWSDLRRRAASHWFTNTAISRLDDKRTSGILIIMQRQHVEDLVGSVLDKSGEDWVHLNLPAIAQESERFELPDGRVFTRKPGDVLHPEREPLSVLQELRRQMGVYDFSAQYLQQPVPFDGEIIKWRWFKTFTTPFTHQKDDDIVQSWDTASKGDQVHDYSVCTTWLQRGDDHYLMDVFRDHLTYPHLKQKVIELAQRHGAETVLIEDAGTGQALIQELQKEGPVRPVAIVPEGDKVTRLVRATSKIEQGFVHLPADAAWLHDFKRELLAFPHSGPKDQVDSLSQYLNWEGLSRRRDMALMSAHLDTCLRLAKDAARRSPINDPDAPWNIEGFKALTPWSDNDY